MEGKVVHVSVPGSTANLGPGFDTLGMALNLYVQIEMRLADELSIELHGDNMEGIPTDETNLIYQVAQQVFERAGAEPHPLHIAMKSDIPLARGLGSSAAAIVGGMVAANALIGHPLSKDELFQMAAALEKHPDNAGASLFGGIVAARWDGTRADYIRIDPDPRLQLLAAVPDFHLATDDARKLIPQQIDLQDAVYNISHSSLLVAALCTGRLDMISAAMKDRLHQPHRAAKIPGMQKILQHACDQGALGAALSGAGPTLIAFVDQNSPDKEKLEQFMIRSFHEASVSASTMWLVPDAQGARVMEIKTPQLLTS